MKSPAGGRRAFLSGLATALGSVGCDVRDFARRQGAKQRLSIATGGTGGVYYPLGGGLAQLISRHVPGLEATAEVTGGSVDNLKLIARGRAEIGFTLADTLADAANGTGTFQTFGRVPARVLLRLYPNHTQIATLATSGVRRLSDLRGRVVGTGSPGSGTETIAHRILAATGIDPGKDVRRQGLGVGPAVEALKDGRLDAFFWSGGLPTGALLDLARSASGDLVLIPCDEALPMLQSRYGPGLYEPLAIPKSAYTLPADVPSIGVMNLLVVEAGLPDGIAHDITAAIFDHIGELHAVHPEARQLQLGTASGPSPVPFHPGAARLYRERGARVGAP